VHRVRPTIRRAGAVTLGLALLASQALVARAHVVETSGPYHLEIGWHVEPTYTGQPNAVEATITDDKDQPITDLGPDDLQATISTAGQTSPKIAFEPAFDLEEGDGTPGQYIAPLVPTAPGDYTFEIAGTIHGTNVDIQVTSGDSTFDPVAGTSDLEFPVKLPTMAEVSTHLDRIDGRIQDSSDAVTSAQRAADRAMLIGGAAGLVGLVIAVVALVVAVRTRRSARTSA
jgi:hypothetical protein